MRIALLVIDVQEEFIGHERGSAIFDETMMYINETVKLFRGAGKPIFVVRDISEGDGPGYENVPELKTEAGDTEILKRYNNSFWKTSLESELRALDVELVVLCGNAAEYCVLATYTGASERDFVPVMLQNGIFAAHEGGLLDAFYNRALIAYDALSYLLTEVQK